MNFWLRRSGYIIAISLACLYFGLLLWGPQGLPSLLEKQRQIRALEAETASTKEQIQRRQERLRKLRENQSYQAIEVRKQLKKQQPGETQFIVPPAKADSPAMPVKGDDPMSQNLKNEGKH
jgi:cell division protein FtsB